MNARVSEGARRLLRALGVASGICVCVSCLARADGGPPTSFPAGGTLGYGPPGIYPGFQGFGLGYHPGYGYGGAGLGVGAEGGYPHYGGPGYPHPWPTLNRLRICQIEPFCYFGGPGFPTPDHPNYFGGTGPLVIDEPVVRIVTEGYDPGYATGYGPYTGGPPNAEAVFAPFTTNISAGAISTEVGRTPSSPAAGPPPATGPAEVAQVMERLIGIDAEPFVDAQSVRGLKVTKVYASTAAERAGLHDGDVIYAMNGYLTQQPANLGWIITNAAPNNILTMRVRTASDGKEHTLSARFP
jgi:hypothetical protein